MRHFRCLDYHKDQNQNMEKKIMDTVTKTYSVKTGKVTFSPYKKVKGNLFPFKKMKIISKIMNKIKKRTIHRINHKILIQ